MREAPPTTTAAAAVATPHTRKARRSVAAGRGDADGTAAAASHRRSFCSRTRSTTTAAATPSTVGAPSHVPLPDRVVTANSASAPPTAKTRAPNGGRARSRTPAPALTATVMTAISTNSATLSPVPKSPTITFLAAGGARSMTAEPTATSGLPAPPSSRAPSSATARKATIATTPHAAASRRGRRSGVGAAGGGRCRARGRCRAHPCSVGRPGRGRTADSRRGGRVRRAFTAAGQRHRRRPCEDRERVGPTRPPSPSRSSASVTPDEPGRATPRGAALGPARDLDRTRRQPHRRRRVRPAHRTHLLRHRRGRRRDGGGRGGRGRGRPRPVGASSSRRRGPRPRDPADRPDRLARPGRPHTPNSVPTCTTPVPR